MDGCDGEIPTHNGGCLDSYWLLTRKDLIMDDIQHILSADATNKTGETPAQFFTRVARDKPGDKTRLCRYCGEDHRGPIRYWPEAERKKHLEATKDLST